MLAEAACSAELGDRRGLGILALEEDHLHFDGALRFSIPLLQIDLLRVQRGRLYVTWPEGTATFDLGSSRAQEWAEMIRHPRSIIDLLGVKPEARVLVVGVTDLDVRRQLKQRASEVLGRDAVDGAVDMDVILLGAETPDELDMLGGLEPLLARDGALWVVHPKRESDLTRAAVIEAGRAVGLTDIKTVPFSLTYVAHKFVVPQARR